MTALPATVDRKKRGTTPAENRSPSFRLNEPPLAPGSPRNEANLPPLSPGTPTPPLNPTPTPPPAPPRAVDFEICEDGSTGYAPGTRLSPSEATSARWVTHANRLNTHLSQEEFREEENARRPSTAKNPRRGSGEAAGRPHRRISPPANRAPTPPQPNGTARPERHCSRPHPPAPHQILLKRTPPQSHG